MFLFASFPRYYAGIQCLWLFALIPERRWIPACAEMTNQDKNEGFALKKQPLAFARGLIGSPIGALPASFRSYFGKQAGICLV
jgi:hypothetical protein